MQNKMVERRFARMRGLVISISYLQGFTRTPELEMWSDSSTLFVCNNLDRKEIDKLFQYTN